MAGALNTTDGDEPLALVEVAATLTCAYLNYNRATQAEIALLLSSTFATARDLVSSTKAVEHERSRPPAVPISKSVTAAWLICLEDGKHLRTLKRYLWSRFKLRPDDYRRKWGLPADYPMVAPSYSKKRSELAKAFGLGRTSHWKMKKGKR